MRRAALIVSGSVDASGGRLGVAVATPRVQTTTVRDGGESGDCVAARPLTWRSGWTRLDSEERAVLAQASELLKRLLEDGGE